MYLSVRLGVLVTATLLSAKLFAQVQLTNSYRGIPLSSADVDYSKMSEVSAIQVSFSNISCSWSDAYLFVEGTPTISEITTLKGKRYNIADFLATPAFSGTGTATWRFSTGETMVKTFSISYTYFGKQAKFLASEIVFPDNKKFFAPGIEALKQQGLLASRENLQNKGFGPELIDLNFSISIGQREFLNRSIKQYENRKALEAEGRSLYNQGNCEAASPKLKAALSALESNYVKQQFNLSDTELKNMIAACGAQTTAKEQAERDAAKKKQAREDSVQQYAQTSESSLYSGSTQPSTTVGTSGQAKPSQQSTQQKNSVNPTTPPSQNKKETESTSAQAKKPKDYQKQKENFERQQAQDAQRAREYEQTKKNTEIAATAGVAAILIHTYIGKLIYTGIPSDENNHWTHISPHYQMALGYGFGVVPYFQKFGRTDDNYTGGKQTSIFTIDLNCRINFNFLMAENYGLGASGNATFGHFLEDYKLEYGYGAMGYLGHKNFKLLAEYQRQYVDFTHYSWIDASSRTSAKVLYKVSRLAAGPRISWGNGQSSNLDLLVGFDKNTREQEAVPNQLYGIGGPEVYTYGGKIQFWKQNVGLFYAELFEVPGFDNEQHYMFKAGYLKSLDVFFSKPNSSFDKVINHHQQKNKLVVSIMNPIISWGKLITHRDTTNNFSNGLGFKFIEVEKELDLTHFLSLSGGLGLSMGRSFQVARGYPGVDGAPQYLTEPSYVSRGLEADLPLGIQIYPYKGLTSSFWLSGKYQLSYSLYEDVSMIKMEPFSTNLRVGLGYDLAWSEKTSYRIGMYYLNSYNTAAAPNTVQLNSIQLQFALLY